MNYGQLRSIFVGERAHITPAMAVNLPEEAEKIALTMFCEAGMSNTPHTDLIEIPVEIREKYEKLMSLLPDGLRVCPLRSKTEKVVTDSFLM